jgi:dihydrofolate reductase
MDLIVAVNSDWGIGRDGTQTVVIPEDRKHFRALTDGGTVVVGHRTLLDFPGGRPLAGRRNIVFSRSADLKVDGAEVVSSVEALLREIAGTSADKVFVIGGSSIFKMLLPYCTRAYVTKIKAAPESDAFFPNLDALDNWVLEDTGIPKSHEDVEYAFQVYRNKTPLGA